MTRNALVSFCEAHKIVLEAWAPLVRGERFDHPVIMQLAIKYSKSPAQILVRYGLERVCAPSTVVYDVLTESRGSW